MSPISTRPTLNVELTSRGQSPLTPHFPPLPRFMTRTPFGLDEDGKHIKDIRGNVIRPVVMYMLDCVEKRVDLTPNHTAVIQRRTPATPEQLGDTAWLVHVAAGCQTLRGALATFPYHHSKQPPAEIEERNCLLRGDECCEWKFIWQETKQRGVFSWFR